MPTLGIKVHYPNINNHTTEYHRVLGTGGRERIILSGLFSLKELLFKRETNGPELTNVLKVR